MATPRWRGDAPLVAQVVTITITAGDATTTYSITINGKVVSYVGSANMTTIATNLTTNLAASTNGEFKEITWTSSTNVITGTANGSGNLLGKPFTATSSVSGGAGTIGAVTTTTTASGPNDVSLGQNWSTGSVPATGDTVVFDQGSSDVLYNLDQHTVTPAAIQVLPGFTGKIGLPMTNADNSSYPYFEYRQTYLKYGQSSDSTNIQVIVQGGGGRLKLDNGTSQATWNVQAKYQRADSTVPQLLLKSTHASTALNCNKGDVGVAFYGGETSTILTLNVGFQSNVTGDSSVILGTGVTLTNTTIVQSGGTLLVNSAVTGTGTQTQYNGTSYFGPWGGTGGLTGLSVQGGTCVYSTTGTLGGTVKVGGSGILDFSQDLRTKTVTNPIEIYGANCQVKDPNAVVGPGTLAVGFNESADASQVNFGINFRLTRSGTP